MKELSTVCGRTAGSLARWPCSLKRFRDSTGTHSFQSGDGASSDCCRLKSAPPVCDSDVTILVLGRYTGAGTAGWIRNSCRRLVVM